MDTNRRRARHRVGEGKRLDARARATPPTPTTMTAVLGLGALGATLGRRTAVGRALGGPVVAMLLGALAAQCGAVPNDGGEGMREIQSACAHLVTPMMVFGADLRAIGREARAQVGPFALAAAATVVGSAAAFAAGGVDHRLAGALAAKNIGGGVNYVAVCAALSVGAGDFTAGIAVDNVAALIFFPLLAAWARRVNADGDGGDGGEDLIDTHSNLDVEIARKDDADASSADALTTAFVTVGALACGNVLANVAGFPTATLPCTTALAVIFATAAPTLARPIAATAEPLATSLLFVFFVIAGASSGDLSPSTLARYGDVFRYCAVLYAVHVALVAACATFIDGGRRKREFILASNAAVGGPATVAALATSAGWRRLSVPAVLCAVAGNAFATFIGIALSSAFGRFAG